MATKGAKKAAAEKVIDGVKMSKVNVAYLTGSAVTLGLMTADAKHSPEELVGLVAKHYAGIDADLQGECPVCEGISSTELDRCPYCSANDDGNQLPVEGAEVAEEAPKPKAALAVVPKPAVKDDLKPSSSLITERELDDKIAKVLRLQRAGAENYWELGLAIKDIFDTKQWELRVRPEDGAPKYKSWDAFVHNELHMTPTQAFSTMDVAAKFTVDQIKSVGFTKLSIVLRAPDEDQAGLLQQAGDNTTRELAEKVKKIKKDKGHVRPSRGTKGGRPGGQVKPASKDKITVAQIEGRTTVKLYKKPPTKTYEVKDLVRAKRFADVPFGTMELTAGVRQTFTLIENSAGEWQLVIETKREEE